MVGQREKRSRRKHLQRRGIPDRGPISRRTEGCNIQSEEPYLAGIASDSCDVYTGSTDGRECGEKSRGEEQLGLHDGIGFGYW